MRIEINHHSNVIDFLKPGFPYDIINDKITERVSNYQNQITNEALRDWKVVFIALYNNVDSIRVFKKTRSFKAEKYKDVMVHIPLPKIDEVVWGIPKDKFMPDRSNQANVDKYAISIATLDYQQFDNYVDYIVETMVKAISLSFEDGFTINGIKIKSKQKKLS